MSDNFDFNTPDALPETIERAGRSTDALGVSANAFATAMTRAFAQASAGGRQLDDVLRSLALRLSNLAVRDALRPLAQGMGDLFGSAGGQGAAFISPFAEGGAIRAPGYFPLGGVGLAGEAGAEAIMPLARASGGSLGIAAAGAAGANITINIATPDAASFRRSEAWLTGQIARAVARGQRGL